MRKKVPFSGGMNQKEISALLWSTILSKKPRKLSQHFV